MKLVPAKIPGFITALYPNLIWNIETKKQELYLTFDDGPTPEITPWVLKQLKQHNARATFFCIGSNIEKHPEIFKQILAEGHAVGNHTYSHLKGWKHKTVSYLEDINKAQALLESKVENKLFRPPYGKLKHKQAKQLQKLGYKIVMWDVLSFDWDVKVSEEECFKNIINSAKKGSIIVMHDSIKASHNLKAVLPKILKRYSKTEFDFELIK